MLAGFAINAICWTQFILWIALGILFRKKGLIEKHPATTVYLAFKIAATPFLCFLTRCAAIAPDSIRAALDLTHTALFWSSYIAGAVLLFFICIEISRSTLAAYPALIKYGVLIVRWMAAVSVIVSLASAPFVHQNLLTLSGLARSFMWAVSVVELCLLAFLCLGMKALRLTYRDFSFGLALGFGLMSISDLFKAAMLDGGAPELLSMARLAHGVMVLAALTVWIVYCVLPERQPQPLPLAADSTVARWNEIAHALGNANAHVAVKQRQPDGFFLSDVEYVVDKVLSRNMKNNESES